MANTIKGKAKAAGAALLPTLVLAAEESAMKINSKTSPRPATSTAPKAAKTAQKLDKVSRAFRAARNAQKAITSLLARIEGWPTTHEGEGVINVGLGVIGTMAAYLNNSRPGVQQMIDSITALQTSGWTPPSKKDAKAKAAKVVLAVDSRVWVKGIDDGEATELFGTAELFIDRFSSTGKVLVRAGAKVGGVAKVVGIYPKTKLSASAPKATVVKEAA